MQVKKIILYVGYVSVAVVFAISIVLLFYSRNKNESGKAKRTIGASYMTMNNPYFEVINEEIKAVVENKGDVLETRDSAMDAEVQAEQVEGFIDEKVDCILINAVDWKAIGSSLKKAKKAGIPVIAVDTLVYDQSLVDGIVVSDNYKAGAQCAKDLMKRKKKGKILFLVQSENKSAIDRIKGFKETLEKAGIKTHFIKALSDREQLVKKVTILPLEVIIRNITAGSFCKRYGVEEGIVFDEPTFELSYKNDDLGDPLMCESHALALKLVTKEQLAEVKKYAAIVNDTLKEFFMDKGLKLVDFKIEFGLYDGQVILADEISPDTCRLWDVNTNEKMDKDRFRRDLGKIEETYAEVLRRVKND